MRGRQQRRASQSSSHRRLVLTPIEYVCILYASCASIISMTLIAYNPLLAAVSAYSAISGVLGLVLGWLTKVYEFSWHLPNFTQALFLTLALGTGFCLSLFSQALYIGAAPFLFGATITSKAPLILLVCQVTSIAIWEETFNCLAIQLPFERMLGVWPSIAVRSTYFAVFHMVAYSANLAYIGAMAIMGAFIGYAVAKTRSLGVAYGMHTFQNAGAAFARGGL